MRTARLIGVLLSFYVLAAVCGFAQRSQATYDEFHGVMSPVVAHTSWIAKDGAPQSISAIAQTTDGYLWLGTPFGLFRFDGFEFSRYPSTTLDTPLPSIDVEALAADGAGGLWIGFRSGGISYLSAKGVVRNYSPANHLGPNSGQKFVIRPNGDVWAIGDYRLYQLRGDRWVNVGAELGLPNDPLFSLYFDRKGQVWTSTRHCLYELRPGAHIFTLFPMQSFMIVDMAETPDGSLWVTDAWHAVHPLTPTTSHPGWQVSGYVRMIADRTGNLWLAQDYQGLTHMSWATIQPSLTKEDGLSSEQTNAIFLDREGDVWVGTARGLDRFRSTSLTKLSKLKVEYYPSLSSDPAHGVWIATLGHPIAYATHGQITPIGHAVGSSPLVCDDTGAVWMVDPIENKLTKWKGSIMSRMDLPQDVHLAPAEALGLDEDGSLLISFRPNGLWRFKGSWSQVLDPALPIDEPVSITRDDQRHVWLGYANGLIVEKVGNQYMNYTHSSSGNLGKVLAFKTVGGRVWAGGTNGIAYLESGAFHRVSWARGSDVNGVSGIIGDNAGNLWLNSATGIVRIDHSQLIASSSLRNDLEFELFDDREGVTGTATQLKPTPSAVEDRDGALWFSTSGEVLSLDPLAIKARSTQPALQVERVTINGTPVMDREHVSTALSFESSHVKELEIDYAGIDLASPEKVVYRYLLENEEKRWHEVGTRRQAFYTHLSPGHYRFRLQTANQSHEWIDLRVPIELVITPAFYQTSWFVAAVAVLAIGLLYLGYILRVRHLTANLRKRLMVRADERLRIARELHDTLLQSIHGLMLRFHFATEVLPEKEPAREGLKSALQKADDVFLEARRRIELLRDEVPEEPDFAQQLTKAAEQIDLPKVMKFRVVEEGERRHIKSDIQRELCRIAREALVNTMHHSGAQACEVILVYGASTLWMRCCDDGVGIPQQVMDEGRRSGHWGLVGMKERAANIEAEFQVSSIPNAGTQIEIKLSGRRAYSAPISRFKWMAKLQHFRRSATGQELNK